MELVDEALLIDWDTFRSTFSGYQADLHGNQPLFGVQLWSMLNQGPKKPSFPGPSM